ncbi:MAG: phenylacetate--CoA ligase family protein [Muribaculaceae bacterium]|nr:phenylacetate--CoA ligase family protein [Muribaculaceae bacterium]MBR4722790.1 phenylacetate--CoA ligase family protein [Muribaculaceae bacterium]MBR5436956.1 phenylacetate--CoA ligase family protein [Muribaculaceae bacterium]MBR5745002.1 phenylacetate--CoA ligase family protein [Muribaculaceae bacterium]
MKLLLYNSVKNLLRSYPFIHWRLKKINRLFEMTREEIDEYNNKEFVKMFRHAIKKSPFYKKFYAEHGITIDSVKSVADIEKLPVITKDIVSKHCDEIATGCRLFRKKVYTSGSTGKSMAIYTSLRTAIIEQAYLYKTRQIDGYKPGERIVSLRGHLDAKHFKLRLPFCNILYLSSFYFHPDKAHDYYNEIIKYKPRAIEGYPSSLYNLCLLLKDAGLKMNIPLCFTSSETLYDFQRDLFKEILGCETFDHYGCTEKTVYFRESHDHKGYYDAPGYSINEFDNGELITTTLINKAFPLIRYKMTDIVVLNEPWVKNMATDPNIRLIDGRVDECFKSKSGKLLGLLESLVKGVPHIKLAQYVQPHEGYIDVNIVPDGDFNESDKKHIADNIAAKIGKDDIDYSINIVDESKIIYRRSGKFSMAVNLTKEKDVI